MDPLRFDEGGEHSWGNITLIRNYIRLSVARSITANGDSITTLHLVAFGLAVLDAHLSARGGGWGFKILGSM